MSKAKIKYIEDGARGSSGQDAQGVVATQAQPASKGKLVTLKEWLGNNVATPMQDAVQQSAQQSRKELIAKAQAQTQAQASGSAGESSSDYDKILQSYRELANSQLDKLDLQRTEARREASVLSDRVTRYLPYLRRSGNTEGSGLSDTADIAAYNRVQNRYSEVDADFAEKQAEIMDSYRQTAAAMAKEEADRKWQSQETAADREWQSAEAEANRAWQSQENAASQKWQTAENEKSQAWQTAENEKDRTWQEEQADKQASTGNYSDAATALGSWFESMADDSGKISRSDLSRLKAFADVFKENLSASDAAQLDVLLSGYESFVRNDTEQAVHDKQTAASSAQYETYLKQMAEAEKLQTYSGLASATVPASTGAGKNFNITLDGKTYKVQVKDTTTDAVVLQAAEMAGEDQPFILNGKMYLMTRGGGDVDAGTVFELEAQYWDSHLFGRLNGDDYKDLYKKIQSSQAQRNTEKKSTLR